MKYRIFAAMFIIVLTISSILPAGEIAPNLQEKMRGLDKAQLIPVIISLAPDKEPSALKSELQSSYSKLADRHRVGLNHLKSAAALSQDDLLSFLYNLERDGLAANIKSHWIINVITADIAVGQLENIAGRPDVIEIFQLPVIKSIVPVSDIYNDYDKAFVGVEENLKAVGADVAWAMGYDGTGRVVCSFDTGIYGNHPALVNKWRGKDGDSLAAWFDPIGGEKAPHTYNTTTSSYWHGTHVMGIMVGHSETTGDTVGVAPGAKWISAAVIDIPGSSIIDAFEWAADPDGDPNTSSDMPDVINHSWGIPNEDMGCDAYFWAMIDNTEALGIVNIFAAGNDGVLGAQSINNPANRATEPFSCFSVGALTVITSTDTLISTSSSRGPSDCDGTTIKPNVVAPGTNIRSSIPSTSYAGRGGTSMAAPHVAGAVAILRQVAPDATVDEIKQALIAGCSDIGQSLPNNDYGYGLIKIPASIAALTVASNPDLRVYSYDIGEVNPGGMASADIVLTNRGGVLDEVYAKISGGTGVLTYTVDSLYFGTIALGATEAGHITFDAIVSDTVTPGTMLSLDMELHGSGGYTKAAKLYIMVGVKPEVSYFTHNTGRITFDVSNFGQYGFAQYSFYPLGKNGFAFDGVNNMYEATFMLATDANHVSDGGRNTVPEPDNDFTVAPGGDMRTFSPGGKANQESWSIFNDSKAENPIGLEITQKTYSWTATEYQQFVIMEYIIRNNSGSTINNLHAGLYINWDANNYIQYNIGGYSAGENLGFIFYKNPLGTDSSHFRGTTAIWNEAPLSYKVITQAQQSGAFYFLPWSEADKFAAMSGGIDAVSVEGGTTLDLAHLISIGPTTMVAGQVDTAVFALVAANTLADLKTQALAAKSLYELTLDVEEIGPGVLPDDFVLYQNYPNPFNPATTIRFSLASRSRVSLSIYDLLGRKVIDLVNEELGAGSYQAVWDGNDGSGQAVSSGVYFYHLQCGEHGQAKKMVLMK